MIGLFKASLRLFLLPLGLVFLAGCPQVDSKPGNVTISQVPAKPDSLPVLLDPAVAGSVNHDEKAFTQGLLYYKGALYESTGGYGGSTVRKLDPASGDVLNGVEISSDYFGEGLAAYRDRLYQLTWQSGVCLIYDLDLKPQKQLFYGTEGWGLCEIPEKDLFAFSDGSAELRFLNPENLVTQKKLTVTDGNGSPVTRLNELEWVNQEIWANVWTSDTIARIDPDSGRVKSWIKFNKLVRENQSGSDDVLNGMAYDPEQDRLWLTGKLWEKIYYVDNVTETFFEAPASQPPPSPAP
jgi:glutamine cyclotransferase